MKKPIVDSQSESEILRAFTILLIHLDDVTFDPWIKEEAGDLMQRNVIMQINIEEVLKGSVEQEVGKPFEHEVQQRGTGDFLVMDYYGLWSHVNIETGARFVAFCNSDVKDARILLSDEYCEQLLDPDVALADTKEALKLLAQDVTTSDVIQTATDLSSQCGEVFGRFIWAVIKQEALLNSEVFEALMGILEAPQTTFSAREYYLSTVYEVLTMEDPPLRTREIRLIQAMFMLLILPEAQALHANIGEVYLPNLVGLNRESIDYTADEVFADKAEERTNYLTQLQMKSESFAEALINWLKGERD